MSTPDGHPISQSVGSGPYPGKPWRVWWRLARPFTLTASAVPVLVGSAVALASGTFAALDLFLAMLLASILIQAATNMFNEYYDFKHGLDTPETVGIAGAIVQGLVAPPTVFKGAIACYAIALGLGLFIVARTSPEVLVAGVASALGGFLYTGGPLPIAYTPFGELEVFIFMGVIIVGLAYYIQAGTLSSAAIWAAIPVGCLVAAILLANNLRDVAADGKIGRKTIPVVLGRRVGLALYGALLLGAFAAVGAAVLLRVLPVTALAPVVLLPVPIRLLALYRQHTEPRPLNAGVRGSAALHARFGLLLTVGIALGALIGWRPL